MQMSLEAAELIDERPDERLDTGRLEPYLRAHLEGAKGPLQVRQFAGGKANLTYLLRLGAHEFVLPRPPRGLSRTPARRLGPALAGGARRRGSGARRFRDGAGARLARASSAGLRGRGAAAQRLPARQLPARQRRSRAYRGGARLGHV